MTEFSGKPAYREMRGFADTGEAAAIWSFRHRFKCCMMITNILLLLLIIILMIIMIIITTAIWSLGTASQQPVS